MLQAFLCSSEIILEVLPPVTEAIDLLLLSIKDWRRSLLLASAALSKPASEIFFVDPEKAAAELFALKLLASRLPLQITDCLLYTSRCV